METMNIYAEEGDKIKFSYPDNGMDGDIETAKKYLEVDKIYTVDYTDVGSSFTYVNIKEIPDVSFNSVMFEDVIEEKDYDRVGDCGELRIGDVKLFDLLKSDKDRYYAVIDNDIIWVVDRELEKQEADEVSVGSFHSYGEEFIMAMFEYMKVNAEYC